MIAQMSPKHRLNNYDAQFLRSFIADASRALDAVTQVINETVELHTKLKNSYCKITDRDILRFARKRGGLGRSKRSKSSLAS